MKTRGNNLLNVCFANRMFAIITALAMVCTSLSALQVLGDMSADENFIAYGDVEDNIALDTPGSSGPSIPPPDLKLFDFGLGSEHEQILPPWPPEPPMDEMPPEFEEPEEPVVEPIPLISPEEDVFPSMPYAPGEKPRVEYNITLADINCPTGIPHVGDRRPLQIFLENHVSTIYTVTTEISVIQPDGSEVFLGTLGYTIPGEMTKERTLTWEPEQGGENTIIMKISYEENGVLIEYTKEVGFYVLRGTEDWGGGRTIPDGDTWTRPPLDWGDDPWEQCPYEIYLYDGDLIIEPGGTLVFEENQYGCRAELIINGEGPAGEAGYWGIDIQKGGAKEGIFEIHDESIVRATAGLKSNTYQFNVHGSLTIDSRSVVKWIYGDDSIAANPGGIHLYPDSTCTISDGAKVSHGWTHNIFVEGNAALTISDSDVEGAGDGGTLGHGIYVTNGASPIIENNNFTSNEDGGIYIDTPMDEKIFNNSFVGNYEGIYCEGTSPNIENNTFLGNDYGIVLDLWAPGGSTPLIQNNTISDGHRQAILGYWSSNPIILNNTIERNGYGIDLTGSTSDTLVKNNTIRYNTFGIWTYQGSPVIVENTVTFNENRGMWFQQSSPLIKENEISYNSVKTLFFDDVESGAGNWIAEGLFHIVDDDTSPPNSYSPTHSWWYGDDATGNYDTPGVANEGYIYLEPIDLTDAVNATLTFQSWYETEPDGIEKDQRWIYLWSGTGGKDVQLYDDEMKTWIQHSIDISEFAGDSEVGIAFCFYTVDEFNNNYQGWYIDDIRITYTNASVEGYGIFCQDASEPIIQNNLISLNNVGIACYENSNPTITKNNITSSMNIGVYVNASSPLIKSNNITSKTIIHYVDPPNPNTNPFYVLPSITPYPTTINLDSIVFEPSYGEPAIPDELRIDSYPDDSVGSYIVQFIGPTQQDWLSELELLGVDIYTYLPYLAYIVGMDATTKESVASLPFVRWVGIYQPAYRIDPRLQTETNQTNITVLTVNNGDVNTIINQIESMSNEIYSQWEFSFYKGVRINVDVENISEIAKLSNIYWIEPYIPPEIFDEVSSEIVGGIWSPGQPWGGVGSYVNSLGYDGSGVIISVIDTGIDTGVDDPGINGDIHLDLDNRVDDFIDYTEVDITDGIGEDENSHGTHCAGIIAGNGAVETPDADGYLYGMGVAPNAHLLSQRIFDVEGIISFPDGGLTELTTWATQHDAKISSNSWGSATGGAYTVACYEFDRLVRDANPAAFGDQQHIIVFAAGNSGWGGGPASYGTIGSPAAAKNVIAVGASLNYRPDIEGWPADSIDAIAGFSSRGPCEDGRIKPDIVAPGTWISSALSSASYGPFWSLHGAIDDDYAWSSGTSMACPQVSGGAGLFVQYYEELSGNYPSPALTKAALINGAVDMEPVSDPTYGAHSTGSIPNNDEGWGRLDLVNVLEPSTGVIYEDQEHLFTESGDIMQHSVPVGDITVPFKVTLTWTDAPGAVNANPALVNDLDLKVTAPDGKVYYGNQFTNGWSDYSKTKKDYINNVESIYINPTEVMLGTYTVEIIAANIAEDAIYSTPEIDQDYALVYTYGEPTSECVIQFDKTAYKSDDTAKVTVADIDLCSSGTVQINALSSDALDLEFITLTETPADSGIFEGTIQISLGGAIVNDGELQVAEGDTIIVLYNDAIDSALIDDMPPIISDIKVVIEPQESIKVTWSTNEDSDSVVGYDTTIPPSLVATDMKMLTTHTVPLDQIVCGLTYYFQVQSTDVAGNTAVDDKLGLYYQFGALEFDSGSGIYVTEVCAPDIFKNNITENYYGIIATKGSSPTISDNNTISKNKYGIYCEYGSPAYIAYNNITNNTGTGIWAKSGNVTILNNTISHNNWSGIVTPDQEMSILGNNITENNYGGIYIDSGRPIGIPMGHQSPIIDSNFISSNNYGISCYPAPGGQNFMIYNNTIINNRFFGLKSVGSSSSPPNTPKILGNNITLNKYYGGVICIGKSPIIANNNITKNENCGIYISSSSALQILNNNISENENGIASLYWSEPSVQGNNITKNNYGIISGFKSSPTIEANNITESVYSGIYCYDQTTPRISFNNITTSNCGIYSTQRSSSIITQNNISYNNYGICCNETSTDYIDKNNITDNGYGIYCTSRQDMVGGIRVDTGTYKVVYLSFGFEGIVGMENRNLLMGEMVDWLDPGLGSDAVLLVDDADGTVMRSKYEQSLFSIGINYDIWNNEFLGSPPLETLLAYPVVIYFTGGVAPFYSPLTGAFFTLLPSEQANLSTYLDGGGKLLLSGQGIGSDLIDWRTGPSFYRDYLHAEYERDVSNMFGLVGVEGDPITDEISVDITGDTPLYAQLQPDVIKPYDEYATPIFTYEQFDFPTIINNTIASNSNTAIYCEYSSPSISGNNISLNNNGIYMVGSKNCTITNNTAHLNSEFGIYLVESNTNTIANNTVSNNDYGIGLYTTNNNTITNNTISENNYGIYSSQSSPLIINNIIGGYYPDIYYVENETVYGPTVFGETSFNIGYTNIIDCTLWVDEDEFGSTPWDWWVMTEDVDYTLDYATGEVTMLWELWDDWYVHAWLNYTIEDIIAGNTFGIYSYLSAPTITNNTIGSGHEFIENKVVFESLAGGETGPFYLGHEDILNCTLYIIDATATWYKMEEWIDYTLDYATGGIITSPLNIGDALHAYYNYTIPGANTYGIYSVSSDPKIDNNTIIANEEEGIYIDNLADYTLIPIIDNNTIVGNKDGVKIINAFATVKMNDILSNKGSGIYMEQSKGEIYLNIIQYNAKPRDLDPSFTGINVMSSTDIWIHHNNVSHNSQNIYLHSSSNINIEWNTIVDASRVILPYPTPPPQRGMYSISSQMTATNNIIWGTQIGMDIVNADSDTIISYNEHYTASEETPLYGIQLNNAAVHLSWNIYDDVGTGISCNDGSDAMISDNTIVNCYHNGIYSGWSSPTITSNTINSNGEWGIFCEYAEPTNAGLNGADLAADNPGLGDNGLGRATQYWTLQVQVTVGGIGDPGHYVEIWDNVGALPIYVGYTGFDGYSQIVDVPQYAIENGGATIDFINPYHIQVDYIHDRYPWVLSNYLEVFDL
ncbi:MAG: right-handed parallel beta-helix repeat-containing protein [Thermoplasmata archaeon]|nr:right-handed parallel beta-helix repeat-containing protein [Thermoplasmata archaeon]